MFQLSKEEFRNLRSHFGTSSWGGARYSPMAFTEQGVAMLSSVLNSDRAIEVNIAIIRAFVILRETVATHKELSRKFAALEQRIGGHDEQMIFCARPVKFKEHLTGVCACLCSSAVN